MDTFFYGKLTVTPWNIVAYNLFSREAGRGPDLYGTEPWPYYFLNLALNFNVILPLALLALPALVVTYVVDRRRLGQAGAPDQSSPYTMLALRVAPVYVWLGLLTAQAHKEERFMFPIYPLICFNAAVTLYLMRGWLEVAYIKATSSPYQVSSYARLGNIGAETPLT
jgi:alpha-1,2-mannosyltransferase